MGRISETLVRTSHTASRHYVVSLSALQECSVGRPVRSMWKLSKLPKTFKLQVFQCR
jgi:hypothetical protein